jgi:hypothetical protein
MEPLACPRSRKTTPRLKLLPAAVLVLVVHGDGPGSVVRELAGALLAAIDVIGVGVIGGDESVV